MNDTNKESGFHKTRQNANMIINRQCIHPVHFGLNAMECHSDGALTHVHKKMYHIE
ncbi:MAG: hypothetical protein Q7V05_11460 [Methanoregula sp.]|nr:hypothetical protein [Methanoregula sp.]